MKNTRLFAGLMAAVMLFGFAGCAKKDTPGNEGSSKKVKEEVVESKYKVGDKVQYGNWNGEIIEWEVLDVKGDKALLFATKVIEVRPYHDEWVYITWEECSLRKWLNGDFYDQAFSDEEKGKIETTTVVNNDNAEFKTPGGNDTQDKVFLLSAEEAEKYFDSAEARVAVMTDYLLENTVKISGLDERYYWLRTPGWTSEQAMLVGFRGDISVRGANVFDGNAQSTGVRPAVWIKG